MWSAIDPLTSCEFPEASIGEADIVLDFSSTHAAPEIRIRDRFAPEVPRLDGARVLQCVTPTLSRVHQTMGSSHLVVSFRFATRT